MPLNNKISTQVKYILKNDSMSTFFKAKLFTKVKLGLRNGPDLFAKDI